MRSRVAFVFAVVVAGWLWMDARAQSTAPLVSGAHRFEKIADGIYYATTSGIMVEIDRAEFRHPRREVLSEARPAGAAGVGRAALRLEPVPLERLLGRDHQVRVDPRVRTSGYR